MTNETLDVIRRRRSVRSFAPDQITDEALTAIVEAAAYAPNGGGEAWHFTVIQNAGVLAQLDRLAKQFAAACGLPWLEALGKDEAFHSVYHAPTVILVSGDEQNVCAESDTAAATQNLLLAAESLGIASCWGYFVTQAFQTDEGKAMRGQLGIPEGYRVYTSTMLGQRAGDAPQAAARKAGTVTYVR
ncbi:nitroreductase family protein [Ruminococcaceae bacterium OttesenSCG-928-D13]|nr:nitroreductase family protein [Ruminococcaceae bacterium OttesenSCG-928-D13]